MLIFKCKKEVKRKNHSFMIFSSRPYLRIIIATCIGCICALSLHAQPCNPPFIQTATADASTIQLSWNPVNNALNYQIELTRLTPTVAAAQIFTVNQAGWTLDDLEPATQYRVRLRSVCANSNSTWSPQRLVTTHYINGQHCQVNLPINLNNCTNPQQLQIVVPESGKLGIDVEFIGIQLLATHPRVSDLTFKLKSPSGNEVTLFSSYNTLGANVGNTDQPQCQEPLFISASSCNVLTIPGIPLRGEVGPFQSFDALRDGTEINGIWTLTYCDNSPVDQGALQYVALSFSNSTCLAPANLKTGEIGPDFVSVTSTSRVFCDSIIYEIVPAGSSPGTGREKGDTENILVIHSCTNDPITILGLNPGNVYQIYTRTKCSPENFSSNSCGIIFETLCDFPALRSGFEHVSLCQEDCETTCIIDTIWSNANPNGLQWVVATGGTPTPFSGPDAGLYGGGNYIYIPTSSEACIEGGPAVLESQCLSIGAVTDGCAMQFGVHQFGNQIEYFLLEAIYGNGSSRDTLFYEEGNTGDFWTIQKVDLSPYQHQVIQLRFHGQSLGPRGNIALDDILFFGEVALSNETFTYYADMDGDGFGDPNASITTCFAIPPTGFVADNTDCNDQNPSINPAASEIPCNLMDDNCSGIIDDIEPDIIIGQIDITPAQCVGAKDGKIQLTQIEGGLPPYQISWSTGEEGSVAEGLSSDIYSVTLSDQAGCTLIVDSIEVPAPQLFSLDQVQSHPATCEGKSDGSLSISASGPFEAIFITWEDGIVAQERADLTPGNYQVTISDGFSCQFIVSDLEVGTQSLLDIELLELQHPRCNGQASGQIRIRVNGDPTHLIYQWSNGEAGPTARSLVAGVYTVTITDTLSRCTGIREYSLNEPTPLEIVITALDPVTCPGSSDGRINIISSGGTPGYRYAWSNGQIQRFTRNLINIPSGLYQLTLTDQANCVQVFDPIEVIAPPAISISNTEIIHNRCPGSTNGGVAVQIEGGTPDYTYLWSNGATGNSIDQVPNGNYIVTVTDELQCRRVFTGINVQSANQPLAYDIVGITPNNCFGDRTGNIIVSIDEVAALPVEFHWSNGRIIHKDFYKDTLQLLASGNYNVTITDAEGCTRIISNIPINGPNSPVNYTVNEIRHISCFEANDGLIRIEPLGGTAPHQIQWQDGTNSATYLNLGPGNYSFTITDANNCSIIPPAITLNEPDPLDILINVWDENCTNGNGRINTIAFGGTSPYDYNWTYQGLMMTGPDLDQLFCGEYNLEVMDFNGCILNETIQLGTVSTANHLLQQQILVYPNPTQNYIYIASSLPNMTAQNANIIIFDTLGKRILDTPYQSPITKLQIPSHTSAGILFVQVIYEDQSVIYKVIKQ